MLAQLNTFAPLGIDAVPVQVEVDTSPAQQPRTVVMGSISTKVESIERARGTREMPMTRERFLAELVSQFPGVTAQIRPDEGGILHCEVGAFRRVTEDALDSGQFWVAECHFKFVERVLREADLALRNALEISYLEDLAFGELTEARYRGVKERMPVALRTILIRHRSEWQ